MAEVVVIEITAPEVINVYNNVNRILGIDSSTTPDEMPAGLISHLAGESGDKLIVVELWESKADQEEFMRSHLGPAFQEANVPQPSRVEWFGHAGGIHRH